MVDDKYVIRIRFCPGGPMTWKELVIEKVRQYDLQYGMDATPCVLHDQWDDAHIVLGTLQASLLGGYSACLPIAALNIESSYPKHHDCNLKGLATYTPK